MSIIRKQKEEKVKELKKKISSSNFVAFLNFHKLSVKKAMELRRALRKANGDYVVSKKTLISVAAKESGLEIDKKKLEKTEKGRILILERMINYGPDKGEKIRLSEVRKY